LRINIEIALYKHKMERELKESERWLAATLKSLGEAVIATDRKGIIKIMNPFAEVLTGWTREESLGKTLASIFNVISEGTDKQTEDPVTKAIRQDSFYGLADHTVLISKECVRIPVDIIGTVIKDDADSVIGVVLVFYDIIERLRIDETLKRALE
jgi:PAS domain S-box-containing protein